MTNAHHGAPDNTLAGRFELSHVLGRGGMATVWAAQDTRLGRPVAVKILHDGLSAEHTRRIEREARASARIADPRVVTLLDLDHTDDGTPFLVFEALSGRTLADEIREDGALAPLRVERLADDLLGATEAAHDCGVLHRDIKPSNVLVDGDGYRITDFGIASVDDDTATRGDLIGTLCYLAPERFDGAPATRQSDRFSAAAVLYEAATGRQPFRVSTAAATIERLRSGEYEPLPHTTSDRLRSVIVSGLDPDPDRRGVVDAHAPTEQVDAVSTPAVDGPGSEPTERLDLTARIDPPTAPPPTGPPDRSSPRPSVGQRVDEFRSRPAVVAGARRARRPETLFIGGAVLLLVVLLVAVTVGAGDGDDTLVDTGDADPSAQLDAELDRIEAIG